MSEASGIIAHVGYAVIGWWVCAIISMRLVQVVNLELGLPTTRHDLRMCLATGPLVMLMFIVATVIYSPFWSAPIFPRRRS